MSRFTAALAGSLVQKQIGRPWFAITFCVAIAHGSLVTATDFVASEMSVGGVSAGAAAGGLDLDEEFEHDEGDPEETYWARKGGVCSNTYGDLFLDYACSVTNPDDPSPGGPSVLFQGERNDRFQLVPGPGPDPPPECEVGLLCELKGYAKILNDAAGFDLNADGVHYNLKVNDVDVKTSWSPTPGRHDYRYIFGITITPNPDGSYSWKFSWQFNDPSQDWNGIVGFGVGRYDDNLSQEWNNTVDFGGNGIKILSILLPDGTTPESHGWEVVHDSGALSPNLRIPEHSILRSTSNGLWDHATTWDDGTVVPSADYSTLVNSHTVTLDANGQAFSLGIRADGTVAVGSGRTLTIVEDVYVEAGKLALARDAAADVSGAFVTAPDAGLEIELAETSSTGSLSAGANVSLAGDLDFRLSGTHPFQAGTHSLMTYDSQGGTFDTVTDLNAYVTGDGLDYGDQELTLTIDHDLLIGDLDLDGDVDFFDYIATSNNFGETEGMRFQDGDMDGDGDVDFFDYIAVSNHFGDALPAVTGMAGAAEVPEPSTVALLGVGTLALLAYGWRRRR